MRSGKVVLAFVLVACFLASAAQAAVITFGSRAAFDAAFPGATVEDWDSYASGTIFLNGSTTNGITYNSSAGDAVANSSFLPSTSPNTLGRTDTNFFMGSDSITFTFAGGISAFGIDINTFALANGGYTATTNLGDVAASVFDPFPGFGTGQFVGFSSDVTFSSVTISAPGGVVYTLDTLRRVPVPEPATLALVGAGLFAAGLRRRRATRG